MTYGSHLDDDHSLSSSHIVSVAMEDELEEKHSGLKSAYNNCYLENGLNPGV